LLDIAPTVLHLLGVPVPDDMDGRVLTELLEPASLSPVLERALAAVHTNGTHSTANDSSYSPEEDAAIQQRLADLGYL
jgi:arylsulfatase A-like enzyme